MTTIEQQALMHKLFELMMASGHLNNQDQMAKELKAIYSLLATRYSLSISECDNCLLYFFRDYSLGCSSPLSDSFIRTNMIPTVKNYPAMDIDAGKELLLSASMFAQSGVDRTTEKKEAAKQKIEEERRRQTEEERKRREEERRNQESEARQKERDEAVSIIFKLFALVMVSGAIWLALFFICAIIMNGPMGDVPGMLVLPAIILAFLFLKKVNWGDS